MLAFIDADSIVYKSAGACERLNPETKKKELKEAEVVVNAYHNAKTCILKILKQTKCDDYKLFLTDSDDKTCFRTKLYPEYKANRIGKERPIFYHEVRKYLVNTWKAEVVETIEADDIVSIYQWKTYNKEFNRLEIKNNIENSSINNILTSTIPSIVCGIDKDLGQIPGLHYNYVKDSFFYVSELEGKRCFYKQVLEGDNIDNIPRIKKGWGIRKEEKQVKEKLKVAKTESEMYNIVLNEYKRFYSKKH